jgi:hypothetical protein
MVFERVFSIWVWNTFSRLHSLVEILDHDSHLKLNCILFLHVLCLDQESDNFIFKSQQTSNFARSVVFGGQDKTDLLTQIK